MKGAKALPFWRDDDGARLREQDVSTEVRGFRDVIKVFLRTWPYLATQIFGYWRELGLKKSAGAARGDGEVSEGNEWSFRHVPPLVTVLALLGPLTGWLPLGADGSRDLLLAATALMAVLCWILVPLKGRLYLGLSLTLLLVGAAANLFAFFVVTGWADNIQVGLVSLGCLCIWLVQYRIENGGLRLRVRLGSHLVYYYLLVLLYTLLLTVTALFTIDLLNQSILQAEPLTPFMADFILRPELGGERVPGTAEKGGGKDTGKGKAAGKDADASEPAGEDGAAAAPAAGPGEPRKVLTAEQRHSLKWIYVVFLVGSVFLAAPLFMVMTYYHVWILQRINQDLRAAMIDRWHRLSLRYHGDHRVGDSVYRVYQDSAQITAVIGAVLKTLPTLQTYAIALVVVAALDPILGLMAVSAGLLAVGWGRWFSPRVRTKSLVAREANSDLTSRIQEILSTIRLVKACGTEDLEQERFERESIGAFNAAARVRSLIAIVGVVMFSLTAILLLGGEFLMAIWAAGGRETFATGLIGLVGLSFVTWNLSAFQWSQGQLGSSSGSVSTLIQQWAQAQDMAMGLDRAFHILDLEPEVVDAPDAVPMPPLQRGIRFDRVGFAYEAERPILRDISFTAKPGTITAIVGPTGSGKSTLVSLVSRLFDPDSGSIRVDGVDLRQVELESLRRNVSVALQENVLFGMSVRDNIRYVVPDADDDRVKLAAEVACVDDYIAGLPEGLDTVLSDRGGKLSTGQRQRLSIARAIIKDAPVLILDEPTAALDAATEHRVLDRLAAWSRGRAIFLITHRISTIQRADQILYLDAGEIVERGSHDELMQRPEGRYRRFVETESRLSKRPGDAGDSESG